MSRRCDFCLLLCILPVLLWAQPQDPYQWLEQDSTPRQQWLQAQERATEAWWARQDDDLLWALEAELRAQWSQPRLQLPQPLPGYDYFFFNPGLQDADDFYRLPLTDSAAVYCVEPGDCQLPPQAQRLLAADWFAPQAPLQAVQPSPDQRQLAYAVGALDAGGADWYVAPIDAAQGPAFDRLMASKLQDLHWSPDNPQRVYYQRVAQHSLHWLQMSSDSWQRGEIALPRDDGSALRLLAALPDGLLIRLDDEVWLHSTEGQWRRLLGQGAQWLEFVTEARGRLWFLDYRQSEFGQVSSVVPSGPDAGAWRTEVAPRPARLRQLAIGSEGLLLVYQHAGQSQLLFRTHEAGATLESMTLPLSGPAELAVAAHPELGRQYLRASSIIQAPGLWRLAWTADSLMSQPVWQVPDALISGHALLWIPLSVGGADDAVLLLAGPAAVLQAWRRGNPGAPLPLLLETYSGFDEPLALGYSLSRRVWLESGGLYARVAVRGSGDYDADWHWQGSGPRRQQSVDDLLAVVSWLQAEGLTHPDQLALMGVSHGASLMMAAALQQPQQFSAVLAVSGVMDMLRYPQSGAGASWLAEYGDPAREAQALLGWSPYHQLLRTDCCAQLPATLLVSNLHDPVVSAWHSMKLHAALLANASTESPHLLSLLPGQSHPEAITLEALIADYTRRWYWLQKMLSRRS